MQSNITCNIVIQSNTSYHEIKKKKKNAKKTSATIKPRTHSTIKHRWTYSTHNNHWTYSTIKRHLSQSTSQKVLSQTLNALPLSEYKWYQPQAKTELDVWQEFWVCSSNVLLHTCKYEYNHMITCIIITTSVSKIWWDTLWM